MIHFVYTHVIVMYNFGKKIKLSVSVSDNYDMLVSVFRLHTNYIPLTILEVHVFHSKEVKK